MPDPGADITPPLPALEVYYDAVPRPAARVEQLGAFTLFVGIGAAWAYYARPTLGAVEFRVDDVHLVRARQRDLGVPEAFEWVAETTPGLYAVVSAAGLQIVQYPLMVLDALVPAPAPPDVEVRLATLDDDLALLGAVAPLAFGAPGAALGPAGAAEIRALAARADPARVAFTLERLRQGRSVMAAAFVDGLPVGVGIHQPVGQVTELTGIGVVPAFRRAGIGAALSSLLVTDALNRGIETVFLSAGNDTSADMYGRIGFQRVGTACIAEPAAGP